MTIEELNLDVRMYNQIKRERIDDTETLLARMYSPGGIKVFSTQFQRNIERVLKDRGIIRFTRGEYITGEDICPTPLTWEQLHAMQGKLVARDISTTSQEAFRVCWIYDFSANDSTVSFQYGNDYANSRDDGRFYALDDTEKQLPVQTGREKAEALHQQIMAFGEMFMKSLWGMCVSIKQMRDSRLYKELGYKKFEDYTEEKLGMKKVQAYSYISIAERLSEDFVQSTERIGMQKLYLLSKITEEQRGEVAKTVDLESVTVRELQAKLADMTKRAEAAEAGKQQADRQVQSLAEQNADLEEQVRELENRPIEVAVPETSHELQNMQDAMRRINIEHDVFVQNLQNDHIKHVQGINKKHREELDALRAEYEGKLKQAGSEPDNGAVFSGYLAAVEDAVLRAIDFINGITDVNCGCEEELRGMLRKYAEEEW